MSMNCGRLWRVYDCLLQSMLVGGGASMGFIESVGFRGWGWSWIEMRGGVSFGRYMAVDLLGWGLVGDFNLQITTNWTLLGVIYTIIHNPSHTQKRCTPTLKLFESSMKKSASLSETIAFVFFVYFHNHLRVDFNEYSRRIQRVLHTYFHLHYYVYITSISHIFHIHSIPISTSITT